MLVTSSAFAGGQKFGLVSKSVDDTNFIDTARACQEAAKGNGDECIHIGGKGAASPRVQAVELENAAKTGIFSAFAVSVIMSDIMADTVRKSVSVPVITFDSPFSRDDSSVSLSYVGPDNVAFGHDLAKIAMKLRPRGGTFCLMGDMHDPNLGQRIRGVRQMLSGNMEFPGDNHLKGEGGWTESGRSPWNSGDDVERTMGQLAITFGELKPDVFISVGQWPVVDPKAYRKTILPFKEALIKKDLIMVVGVGKILPEYSDLMNEGLIHGFVSIDFPEIGRLSYGLMRDASLGKHVPRVVTTSNKVVVIGETP